MATTVEQIQILVDAKVDKALKGLKKTEKQSKTMTKSLTNAAKIIGGAAVTGAIINAFVRISKESEQLAISAEEISGKFNVVFRDVGDSANAMADKLADDFDLASSTVEELLGNTGDLVTGFGLTQDAALKLSDQTNRLALDLASFTNAQGGSAAVSRALTAAYSGERESLKTYGIVITEADVKARMLLDTQKGMTFESEKAAKINATLALATEQSKNAIGDYARTAESGANVQRTLNEQIKRSKELWGSALTEGLTPMRSAFRDFLKEINDAQESEKNISDALYGEGANLEQAVSDLKELEKTQQALFDAQARGSGDDYARVQLRQTQDRLAQLEKELEIYNRRESAIKQNKLTLDAEAEAIRVAAEEEEKRNNLSIAAFAEIESRRVAALSEEEKQVELLQAQIDKWVEFREVAGVQQLINSLVAERTKLLEDEAGTISEGKTLWMTDMADKLQANADYAERVKEIAQEQANREIEEQRRVAEEHRIARDQMIMDVQMYGNATMSVFSGIGQIASNANAAELQRMEEQGASQEQLDAKKKELAKKQAIYQKAVALASIAVNAPSAIIKAFADGGPILAGIVGTAVGIKAIAAATAPIPSFEEGGIVPGTSYTGDNMLANVNSGEMILNKGHQQSLFNQLQGGNNMNNSRFVLVLDNGSELFGAIRQEFDNGGLTVPERNVIAS